MYGHQKQNIELKSQIEILTKDVPDETSHPEISALNDLAWQNIKLWQQYIQFPEIKRIKR